MPIGSGGSRGTIRTYDWLRMFVALRLAGHRVVLPTVTSLNGQAEEVLLVRLPLELQVVEDCSAASA